MSKINVSNEFIEIYRNFNVSNQIENMRDLDKRELYLLLITCLDKHTVDDQMVLSNFMPFKDECMKIYDIQDDKDVDDQILTDLVTETKDKYIDIDILSSKEGSEIPDPYTREEVRDIKIDNIIK